MKELIEKMREAIDKGVTPNTKCITDGYDIASKLCAEIAEQHYNNRWVSVDSGVLPPEAQFAKGLSVELYIYDGVTIREGFYYFKDCEWCNEEGDGIPKVTHYMIKHKPTPPHP